MIITDQNKQSSGNSLIKSGTFILAILLAGISEITHAQFRYQEAPVLQVIGDIERQTSFKFLYRDALVSDMTLSFSANESNLLDQFRTALRFHNLNLNVDSTRNQAIIFQSQEDSTFRKQVSIRGQVVDASTGERLPFANISWQFNDGTTGVSANESGSFRFRRSFAQNSVTFRCSYIGYAAKTVILNVADLRDIHELTFRLQPQRIDGSELVIVDTGSYGSLSEETATMVDIGTFSPIGETNTLRALQALPAVSQSPAMSDGLHVRGSPADGFQVLLDEIPIYNQTHLFGLLDSFNADILQRNMLFYGIAPAQFQAPPGGTLSLDTQSGSLKNFSGTAGISNSSARLSLGGPIKKGSSSWLISGRKSFMNEVNWLNNSSLIEWGLDVGRNRGVLDQELADFESQLVRPNQTEASFFDLHGKIYVEGDRGNRLIISGYLGGDDTKQTAHRLFESFSMPGQQNFDTRPVSTANDWHNGAGSIQYQQWLSENIYSNTTAGGSIYQTSFSKDDFSYTSINATNQSLRNFIYPFENRSVLNELKMNQHLEWYAEPWIVTSGLAYHYFLGEYYEDSFDHPGYFNSQKAHQLDAYTQVDYTGLQMLDIFAGMRMHYYSNGQYLRWSPRLKLTLFPEARLSVSAGFSRNHQFLNQTTLSNTVTADVWVLADNDYPATSVNYYSAGLYFDLTDYFYAQTEGYIKEFDHLRLHETNTYSLGNSFGSAPWFTNNSGSAQGLEFLLSNRLSFVELSQTFTYSEILLSNPVINGGEPFYADWDRRYQYHATLGIEPIEDLSVFLSWMYATGTPNKLATFGAQNDRRLSDYQRADVSAEYSRTFGTTELRFSATLFNVLDQQNPWYRKLAYVIDQNATPSQFQSVPVDVYDMGFQPSFNISVTF